MPFDSFFMYGTVCELNTFLPGARLEKISQPEQLELRLTFRCADGTKKLLISARPGYEGLYFTDTKRENPDTPPMFCMLLRKHLSRAKLLSIKMEPPERVCVLDFLCIDDFGDETQKSIIFECAGRISNIILCDAQMHIIDCLKRQTSIPAPRALCCPGCITAVRRRLNIKIIRLRFQERSFFTFLNIAGLTRNGFLRRVFGGFLPFSAVSLRLRAQTGTKRAPHLANRTEKTSGVLFLLFAVFFVNRA